MALGLTGILSLTQELAGEQLVAWSPTTDPTGPAFLSLALLLCVAGLLRFVKGMMTTWHPADE